MNIVMVTNTYTPHVGGVARSVANFSADYRRRGHRVLVVAPEYPGMPSEEEDVARVPAIRNFNGSDFSVALPVSGLLTEVLDRFRPDLIHAHHPYLLGMTAVRIARYRRLPLVFTHHTLYEQYTHYVPGSSPALARFAVELATRYANLTDQVFAPSESTAELLRHRGVETPIAVLPTGIDVEQFRRGDGLRIRRMMGIARDAFVVGHVGRLAVEKNLAFLAEALASFLRARAQAHVLIVGGGPAEPEIRTRLSAPDLAPRVHMAGIIEFERLADFYHAMDAFAFSSLSETQGMVVTEALACGIPVVALDAPGVREVVEDRCNGYLLNHDAPPATFATALARLGDLTADHRDRLRDAARDTAVRFSRDIVAARALSYYEALRRRVFTDHAQAIEQWERTLELIRAQWGIVKGVAGAAGAVLAQADREARLDRRH